MERAAVLEEIRDNNSSPLRQIRTAHHRVLFHANEPEHYPVAGDLESVSRISADMVNVFTHQHYRPGNAHLIITGAFDIESMTKRLEPWFGDATTLSVPHTSPLSASPPPPTQHHSFHSKIPVAGSESWDSTAFRLPNLPFHDNPALLFFVKTWCNSILHEPCPGVDVSMEMSTSDVILIVFVPTTAARSTNVVQDALFNPHNLPHEQMLDTIWVLYQNYVHEQQRDATFDPTSKLLLQGHRPSVEIFQALFDPVKMNTYPISRVEATPRAAAAIAAATTTTTTPTPTLSALHYFPAPPTPAKHDFESLLYVDPSQPHKFYVCKPELDEPFFIYRSPKSHTRHPVSLEHGLARVVLFQMLEQDRDIACFQSSVVNQEPFREASMQLVRATESLEQVIQLDNAYHTQLCALGSELHDRFLVTRDRLFAQLQRRVDSTAMKDVLWHALRELEHHYFPERVLSLEHELELLNVIRYDAVFAQVAEYYENDIVTDLLVSVEQLPTNAEPFLSHHYAAGGGAAGPYHTSIHSLAPSHKLEVTLY